MAVTSAESANAPKFAAPDAYVSVPTLQEVAISLMFHRWTSAHAG
jgi:hypothetical protein